MLNFSLHYSFDNKINFNPISKEIIKYIEQNDLEVQLNPSNKTIFNIFSKNSNDYIQLLIYIMPGEVIIKLKLYETSQVNNNSLILLQNNQLIDIMTKIPKKLSELLCLFINKNEKEIILSEAKFCPHCGAEFNRDVKYCPNCNKKIF